MKKRFLWVFFLLCLCLLASSCEFGIPGQDGKDGAPGKDGADGKDGINGTDGKDGKSAYELALEDGFEGSLHEWLLSLAVRGTDGSNGSNGKDGKDGVGIENVMINSEGHLIVILTDGTSLDAGEVNGGNDYTFSDEPDEMGFYPVYEMVVMTGQNSLWLRLEPDIYDGEQYTTIPKGTVLLRVGDQKVEDGYSRFLYNGVECYARSHHFEMKYNYAADIPAYHLPETVVLTKGVRSWFYTDQILPNCPDDFKVSYSYSGSGERFYDGEAAFGIEPSVAETATLTVKFAQYDNGELTTVALETVKVIVVEKQADLALTGLFLGDSRISGGDLLYAITGSMPNLNLIGTRPLSTSGIYHEGRGAWSTETYLTKASSSVSGVNTSNAFYNASTEKFDFTYYMTQNGFNGEALDFVVINLGANDGFSEDAVENLNTMVSSIRAYSSDIKILIMTEYLAPADNYYLTGTANRNIPLMRTKQFRFNFYLEEQFSNREDESIYLIPNYLVINGFSDWPCKDVQTENGTEKKIYDVIHLSRGGYVKEAAMLEAYLYRLYE